MEVGVAVPSPTDLVRAMSCKVEMGGAVEPLCDGFVAVLIGLGGGRVRSSSRLGMMGGFCDPALVGGGAAA